MNTAGLEGEPPPPRTHDAPLAELIRDEVRRNPFL